MVRVMTVRKLHMTDSNFLQLIIFLFGIFWQGFPCLTVSAVTDSWGIWYFSQNL